MLLPFLRGTQPMSVFDIITGKIFGVYGSMENINGRKLAPLLFGAMFQ